MCWFYVTVSSDYVTVSSDYVIVSSEPFYIFRFRRAEVQLRFGVLVLVFSILFFYANIFITLLSFLSEFKIVETSNEAKKNRKEKRNNLPDFYASLIHSCLASHFWDIGKRRRPRADAAGSILFAYRTLYSKTK